MRTDVLEIKPWLLAMRPKTLTAAVIPVAVGTMLAKSTGVAVDWVIAVYALAASLFIQIGTNLINDALDFKKGGDTRSRVGPVRVTQMGLLSMPQVLFGGFLCLVAATFFSIPLIFQGGLPIAVVVIASVLCAYLYTGGPIPLAYHGLGDIFVLLFFGIISTAAIYYLQARELAPSALLAGTQIGLLATVMIAINNLRDYYEDSTTGKRTMAVRFGKTFARVEITVCTLLPFVIGLFWIGQGYFFSAFLPFMILPVSTMIIRGIWLADPAPIYNRFLGMSALLHLLFGTLLIAGFWLR